MDDVCPGLVEEGEGENLVALRIVGHGSFLVLLYQRRVVGKASPLTLTF